MWFLFAFLFVNHASCCQGQHLVERNITKDEADLLFKYINDKCEERTKKAHMNRITKTLHRTLQTIRVVQQKQVVLDQLKTVYPTWLETIIDNRLNALLKGIAGALIEAQFNEIQEQEQSDYTIHFIMVNEWRKLHLLFHISKDTLKDTNQRIIAFDALKPKLYEFFHDDQSISARMLSDFTNTYENYVRHRSKQPNRKIEIQNRIGLYIFLLTQQGLSEKKFWKKSTLDEIMRSFMNLLDSPLFENVFAPIIYDEKSCFYKFIERLATVQYAH